eukprot:GDKH01000381.1.p1 GENE.GDKH01000381.1~~GDKH01000381.1.p1  ORF type:complete len:56 (+),score=2.06 GDKH01000381.1:145-312(+)
MVNLFNKIQKNNKLFIFVVKRRETTVNLKYRVISTPAKLTFFYMLSTIFLALRHY